MRTMPRSGKRKMLLNSPVTNPVTQLRLIDFGAPSECRLASRANLLPNNPFNPIAAKTRLRVNGTLGLRRVKHLGIKARAILIGFNPAGECVYSASIPVGDYWDVEHVWDNAEQVESLKLEKVVGFLFGQSGNLMQHFESTFDIHTGVIKGGWTKHEDGTFQKM